MIWTLLLLFQLKHFLCDYPLQGKFMLGKFKRYPDFIMPLLAHSAVHGLATFLISYFYLDFKYAILLSAMDMFIHFIVDRVKASPDLLGRFEALSKGQFKGLIESKALAEAGLLYEKSDDLANESKRLLVEINGKFKSNVFFWWSLGADQTAHHLTHYGIIYLIMVLSV